MKREDALLLLFALILFFSVIMLLLHYSKLTGYATSGSTVSNVTITSYLSISMSANLQEGILFGSVDTLPALNISASHNYDGGSSASTMFINVSTDSNTAVDFCIKANAGLQTSGAEIGIGNETYSNSTSTNSTVPAIANNVSLTTGYVKNGANVAQGNSNYYRFWLNIPAAQAPGTYNNSVSFKGVATTVAC